MTPESRKLFNTWMGSLLIFMAMVCFGLAGYMIFVPNESKPEPAPTFAVVNKQPCLEGLAALNLSAVAIGRDIRVTDRDVAANALDRLKTASLGVSMCHMYLKSFCMGPSCEDPNALTFVLAPSDPSDSSNRSPSAVR